jgi:hypothetical protein
VPLDRKKRSRPVGGPPGATAIEAEGEGRLGSEADDVGAAGLGLARAAVGDAVAADGPTGGLEVGSGVGAVAQPARSPASRTIRMER